jgi:hypothetical protein
MCYVVDKHQHAFERLMYYWVNIFWLVLFLNIRYNLKKLTYEERKVRLLERLNAINSSGGADDDEDDE